MASLIGQVAPKYEPPPPETTERESFVSVLFRDSSRSLGSGESSREDDDPPTRTPSEVGDDDAHEDAHEDASSAISPPSSSTQIRSSSGGGRPPMLSRAVLGDRQPPRLTTALGGGQGKGEGLPPGAKTMGFGMQRSTKSSRNLLDPPADDSGTNEGEMAGGSCKAEGSRRTASPHPSDQISAVVGSADTSAAAPPSPDSIGCWHAFEFGALYCESYSAESVRLLRKQQKRTHQLCCAWLANRQQLLEAFEAADEASANGGVSVDSSGGDDRRPRSDEARSDGPRKPARGVLTLGEMSSIAAEVAFSSATIEARHVHTEARHVHRFLMQLARLKSPLMPEAISMLLSLGSFDPPPDLSGAKSGARDGAVALPHASTEVAYRPLLDLPALHASAHHGALPSPTGGVPAVTRPDQPAGREPEQPLPGAPAASRASPLARSGGDGRRDGHPVPRRVSRPCGGVSK